MNGMESASTNHTINSMHGRTLTAMLSPIPSESSATIHDHDSGPIFERAHSEPPADSSTSPLQPPVISPSLAQTHGAIMMQPPPMQHSLSDPSIQQLNRADLKAFDPYNPLSPPPPIVQYLSPLTPIVPMQPPLTTTNSSTTAAGTTTVVGASHLLDSSPPNTHSLHLPSSSPPGQAILVGNDHTLSSVSSYSSTALSSGSFTAISVSPTPTDVIYQQRASSNGRSASVDVVTLTPLSSFSTAALPATFAMVASSSSVSSSSIAAAFSTSTSELVSQPLAHLSITTPNALASPLASSSYTSQNTAGGVRFDLTESGPESRKSYTSSVDTPSTVRMHHEEGATPMTGSPTYPSDAQFPSATAAYTNTPSIDTAAGSSVVQPQSILSPSFPLIAASSDEDVSPDNHSPLPPVVSALMAAQKVVGTTPGTTLAVPAESQTGRLIFICGDASGAGKSCIAMGLLHLLLKRGYDAKELGYIKPCTQCEDIQIVSKYCESMGIAHVGLGPVIFYEGFTQEVIDGKAESVDKRRGRIHKAVNKMAEGKKWVLVDGVGYGAVGSVAGVSNAEVASLLNAPVLVVGRPGIGNAIDAMNFIIAYFEKYHVHTLGACWNKIPPMSTYHTYDKMKQYVNKYFREVRSGCISTYGHIPLVTPKTAQTESATSEAPAVSCRLRPAKKDLQLTPSDELFVIEFLSLMEREFDIESLLADLNKYYQAHRVQLVSVV